MISLQELIFLIRKQRETVVPGPGRAGPVDRYFRKELQ